MLFREWNNFVMAELYLELESYEVDVLNGSDYDKARHLVLSLCLNEGRGKKGKFRNYEAIHMRNIEDTLSYKILYTIATLHDLLFCRLRF
mmetsp:Transcript_19843/g.28529  ORF Transcript_19843/g.28529 Transcript_19843/m.28529 type:complete len:90 (+) Transcript_19843:200-469(+)